MTADVISLRPVPVLRAGVRPVLAPSACRARLTVPVPVPVPGGPVVEWDPYRGLHAAVCERCCESFDAFTLDQAHQWAEAHRCDPELAELLAEVLPRRAA